MTSLADLKALAEKAERVKARYEVDPSDRRIVRSVDVPAETVLALVAVAQAAQVVDDLAPTTHPHLLDAEFHAAVFVLHEALAALGGER